MSLIRRFGGVCCCLYLILATGSDLRATTRWVPQDYATIQAAVTACVSGDTVLIADGTYTGVGNRDITFPAIDSITIRSASGPGACIIDCDLQAQAFILKTPSPGSAIFQGLTIREGKLETTTWPCYGRGGAIYVGSSDVTLDNCIFEDCVSVQFGGAVGIIGGTTLISNCRFTECLIAPAGYGGGLAIVQSDLTLIDCQFGGNRCTGFGGGAYLAGVRGDVSRCRFDNNISTQGFGGGLSVNECSAALTISNCGFEANRAVEGSAIHSDNSSSHFDSCSAAYNILVGGCGGMNITGDSKPSLRNCIFFSNGGNEIASETGNPPVSYSNIFLPSGVYPGTGNINEDPVFVSVPTSDLYLSQTSSPCINAGSGPASDLCFDTGAGVFCQNTLTTASSGMYDSGITDMGCHFISNIPTPTPPQSPTPTPPPTITPTPTRTATVCTGAFYEFPILTEDFETWPPAGWSIFGDEDCVWESNTTCGRPNHAGYQGDAACADNDWCGVQGIIDSTLESPPLDLSAFSQAVLEFTMAYNNNDPAVDFLYVEWHNGNGDWDDIVNIEEDRSPDGPGEVYRLNLTSLVGHSNGQIRFHYYGEWIASYALIDHVMIKVCMSGQSPTPTPTRTPTATWTPAPTWTPTTAPGEPTNTPHPASPTPGDCTESGCTISMPSHDFGAGDPCSCDVLVCNATGATLTDIPVFVLLDVYGSYFFAPDFSEFAYYLMPLSPGNNPIQVLPTFAWPTGAGAASGIKWYAAMTNPGMTELYGSLDTFEFGWH